MPRYIIISPVDDVRCTDDAALAADAGASGFDIVIDVSLMQATYDSEAIEIKPITRAEWEANND